MRTLEEVNNRNIGGDLSVNDEIYGTPESWGEEYFGTKEQFKEMIDCKSGFGADWYQEAVQEDFENALTVEEYEKKLLSELESIQIDLGVE